MLYRVYILVFVYIYAFVIAPQLLGKRRRLISFIKQFKGVMLKVSVIAYTSPLLFFPEATLKLRDDRIQNVVEVVKFSLQFLELLVRI